MSSRVHLIDMASGDISSVEVSVLHATWTICSTHIWNQAEMTLVKKRKERKRRRITTYLLFYMERDWLHYTMYNSVMNCLRRWCERTDLLFALRSHYQNTKSLIWFVVCLLWMCSTNKSNNILISSLFTHFMLQTSFVGRLTKQTNCASYVRSRRHRHAQSLLLPSKVYFSS